MSALAMVALLAGCANGDFGEVRPFLVSDGIHDWLGAEATARHSTSPSKFELTDDERQLRDLAYPLIEPPYDRQRWYSVLGEYGVIGSLSRRSFDRTAYSHHLMSARLRSPSARYAQITEDVNNDITRIPEFFETAGRVLDIDQKRRKSLAYISDVSPKERDQALRRIRENILLISLVSEKLAQRAAGYRFALERLVITVPSPLAVGVEQSLNQLRAQLARYRTRSAPTWVREQSLAAAN